MSEFGPSSDGLVQEMHRLLDSFVELEPDQLEVMVAGRLLRTTREAIALAVAANRCGQADPCECGNEGVPICCVAGEVTPDGHEHVACHGDRDDHPAVGCWCVCHGADCPVSGGSVCRCGVADEPDQGLYLRSGANADPSDWEL